MDAHIGAAGDRTLLPGLPRLVQNIVVLPEHANQLTRGS
jgi:hypothetical protein